MNPAIIVVAAAGIGGAAWWLTRGRPELNPAAHPERFSPHSHSASVYVDRETGELVPSEALRREFRPGERIISVSPSGRIRTDGGPGQRGRSFLGPDETHEDVWRDALPSIFDTVDTLREPAEAVGTIVDRSTELVPGVDEFGERVRDTQLGRAIGGLFG